MMRVAKPKHDAIVEIPGVVWVHPIRVEPQGAIVVALDVEDVRVAIGVGIIVPVSS